jgi:hypothetical protein
MYLKSTLNSRELYSYSFLPSVPVYLIQNTQIFDRVDQGSLIFLEL